MLSRLHMRFAAATVFLLLAATQRGVAAQPVVTFEQTVEELRSEDESVRLRAIGALAAAGYPEAAEPLADVIASSQGASRQAAIGAELRLFLVESVVSRRRVALVVEVRDRATGRSVFESGPAALDPRPVSLGVLSALRAAARDPGAETALEAAYAFGALSANAYGRDRDLLRTASARDLAALLESPERDVRLAAVQVIGRLYERTPTDEPADAIVGDALVVTLNDRDNSVRRQAMDALGALRYEGGVQALSDLYGHYRKGADAVAALTALARIAHPSSVPLFEAALSGRDRALWRAAVEGLARSADSARASAISGALRFEHARDLLLAGGFAEAMLANGSINELVDGLTRPALRDQAFGYLVEVAPKRVALLSPHLADPDPQMRADLLEMLGMSGTREAAPLVAPMLRDPDPAVARAATRALHRLIGPIDTGQLR